MTTTIVACDPVLGLPRLAPERYHPDRADLLSEMDRLGVAQALVRHRSALDCGPTVGNSVILQELSGCDRLHGTWFVTPDGFEPDFDPGQAIDLMLRSGIKACWTDPVAEEFSPLPWCSGPLYETLQERRVPLLLDYDKVKPDQLDTILSSFPGLRTILLGVPRMGRHRILYPLLRRHSHLWLCLSHTYSVHRGIEDLCRTFGHERWVFGIGYPEAEGGAAIAGLSFADISCEAKEAIAHDNIERLLAQVRMGTR